MRNYEPIIYLFLEILNDIKGILGRNPIFHPSYLPGYPYWDITQRSSILLFQSQKGYDNISLDPDFSPGMVGYILFTG